jgi:acetylornithine deacetylase/succinyl-diaminopimelate desuccinylase-like protein
MTDSVLDHLRANHKRILSDLIAFASIPSVSSDAAYKGEMQRAARWAVDQLTNAGPFNAQIIPTERHPLVYAEWLGAPGKPTILVYGHYDVQPPDPLDKWRSAPFKPEVRPHPVSNQRFDQAELRSATPSPPAGRENSGAQREELRLYARGVSDDKGPLLIPIKVAEAYFATEGLLPVNVKFLIEGEEEIGSPSLTPFIRDHADLLEADFVLSADGAMWRIDEPSITVASRGSVGLEITLTGASKDLHSGRHGGAVANPLHAIAQLVASLHTADGRIAVDRFYEAVEELSAEDKAAILNLPFDEQAYLAQVGAPAGFGEPGYSTLERLWTRPTVEVNGMWGGYQGQGSKTVIPYEAHAKITCRLVPKQQPDDIADKVIRHLETHLPLGVRLHVQRDSHGALSYRIPADHVGLAVARAVLREVYQQEPLLVRMGGTIPVSELFKRFMGLETVFFSFSTADEDFHAPNEFFRVNRLYEGLEAWARYWERLAGISAK